MNEADDCGVFVEVVCVAGDVPLGVAVDQVEEVHCPSCGGRPFPSSGLRRRLAA